jgi:hypothetical protein
MVSIPSVGVVMNWGNENNKSGLYPVHIRIKQGNTARYPRVPTRLKVRPDQWSEKDGAWVKQNHPFAFEINNKIIEIKGLINEYIKRMVNFGKPVTVHGIIASLTKKGDNKCFLDFMQRVHN